MKIANPNLEDTTLVYTSEEFMLLCEAEGLLDMELEDPLLGEVQLVELAIDKLNQHRAPSPNRWIQYRGRVRLVPRKTREVITACNQLCESLMA